MNDRSHTLKNERRDFVEWHRGRAPYVLWAIDVDLPEVRERVARAEAAMGEFLLPGYGRQPHVTVALCGFPATGDCGDDEFHGSCLAAQVAAMAETMAGIRSFDVHIGALATFDTVPYLAVLDPESGISAIRAALTGAPVAARRAEGRREDGVPHAYVPHVTVGLYADRWPLSEVRARIASFAHGEALAVRIDRVSLLAYDPREIGGPLAVCGEFLLDNGVFSARQGELPESLLCGAQNS